MYNLPLSIRPKKFHSSRPGGAHAPSAHPATPMDLSHCQLAAHFYRAACNADAV